MQEFIPIIIDVIALVIMLGYIYRGYKNGFLYTVLRLVGTILSAFGSYAIAKAVAPLISQNTRDYWMNWVELRVGDVTGLDASAAQGLLETKISPSIQSLLEVFGVSVDGANGTKNVVEVITDSAVLPIVNGIIECILFLLAFALLAFICRRILGHLRNIRVPVIGTCNALLGALLGILQGALVLLIWTTIASIVVAVSGNALEYFNIELLRHTHLFYWVYQLNPFRIV